MMENSPAGMVLLEPKGVVAFANQAFADLLGYSRKTCVGRDFARFVHDDDFSADSDAFKHVACGKKGAVHLEQRLVGKNGHQAHTRISLTSLDHDDAQQTGYVLVQVVAIDQPSQSASALADSEMRFGIAIESAKQGVWDHDNVTGEKFYSRTWKEMRGRDPDAPVDNTLETWLDRIHPDDRERVTEYVGRQDAGELDEVAFEFRERHADGHWIWILSRGKPVGWKPDGTPARVIGTDTDITELKESQEAVERLSRRTALAMSTSRFGVWEFDLGTGDIVWDDRLRELFGFSKDAKIDGGTWAKALHHEDVDEVLARSEQAMVEQKPYSQQYRIVRTNGEVRHIRSRATFHNEDDGRQTLVGVDLDVTADVEAAEDLRRATQLAEQRNQELEQARQRMEHNSLHDALTGLPNRRYLDDVLEDLASQSKANNRSVALLHIDLDRFKQINDTLGHAAGDAMLVHAASVLQSNVRKGDIVARIGGDEFVVVRSAQASLDALSDLAGRVIGEMSKPVPYEGHECRFGVSIGIARETGKKIDPKAMLVNADIALYRAKSKGRNCFEFFTDELHAKVIATKKCADEILVGLERDEFIAWYQPQFDARTFDLTGVEALSRWQHPDGKIRFPDQYLPVAEDLSVVSTIDRLIFERAVADLASWEAAGLDIPKVSVNVSARRLGDADLIDSLKSVPFKQGTISFELLESIFLDERDDVVVWNIDRIKEMGIGIEIDDFGSGHASIVGLLHLNPNRLKIDRQLVMPVTESGRQARLVKSIVDIGKSLGVEVVAEGVETFEQAHLLRDLGCDVLQGYAFARPMPYDQLVEFVSGESWRKAS